MSCDTVSTEWLWGIIQAYEKEQNENGYVFVWSFQDPANDKCKIEDIVAVAFLEVDTEPTESTVDLVSCACKGCGVGSHVLRYLESFVLEKNRECLHVCVNSIPSVWMFYWKNGYRVDHRVLFPKTLESEYENFDCIKEKIDRRTKRAQKYGSRDEIDMIKVLSSIPK